jgi:hypothetical protein
MRCLVVVGLVLVAACSSPPTWRAVEHRAPLEDLWARLLRVVEVHGFVTDAALTDRGERTYTSKWRTSAVPFGKGQRTRLHARFERPEERADTWRLEYWVERQTVGDFAKSFEPEEQDWSAAGQDREREDIIFGQLRLVLGQDIGVSPRNSR